MRRADGLSSDLLRDPRHLRGDLRLLWSAVRSGQVPDDRRAALSARLWAVVSELDKPDGYPGLTAGTKTRAFLLAARVAIAMTRANLAIDNARITADARAFSRLLGGKSDIGRPRTRVRPRR